MLDIPWFNVEEGIQWLSKSKMLEFICHFRLRGSRRYAFYQYSNKFVRGAIESLNWSLIAFLYTPDLTVRIAVTELGNLYTME